MGEEGLRESCRGGFTMILVYSCGHRVEVGGVYLLDERVKKLAYRCVRCRVLRSGR